jgi:hypothetical protein
MENNIIIKNRQVQYFHHILFVFLFLCNEIVTTAQFSDSDVSGITIKNSVGNLYSVNAATGQATHLGKASDDKNPYNILSFDKRTIAADRAVAIFAPATDSKYAFDAYNPKYAESLLFTGKYEELRTSGGEAYAVPFKLIPAGATDAVQETITSAALAEGLEFNAIDPAKIIFRTANGAEYLGIPSTGFSQHNYYMDYNIKRKMFFKTQINTVINNLKKGNQP